MICFFEKRAARRENFAAGGLSFLSVYPDFRRAACRFFGPPPIFGGRLIVFIGLPRFAAGGLSVFVKFGDFYSTSFGDFYSTSTVSQVKTLNKIVFLTFSFITFSTAFL